MKQKTRRLIIAGLAALLAVVQTAPRLTVYEDGSASVDFCIPLTGCSGFLHTYGNSQSANEGIGFGNCGYETRGEPGFYCLDADR